MARSCSSRAPLPGSTDPATSSGQFWHDRRPRWEHKRPDPPGGRRRGGGPTVGLVCRARRWRGGELTSTSYSRDRAERGFGMCAAVNGQSWVDQVEAHKQQLDDPELRAMCDTFVRHVKTEWVGDLDATFA